MTGSDRTDDVTRIEKTIDLLAAVAGSRQTRAVAASASGASASSAKNHRTRLTTDEFAFYPQERPIHVDDFLGIVEHVEAVARSLPPNVTLILASFPVHGEDGVLHNVVVHAQSGADPRLNVFAKATVALMDPHYSSSYDYVPQYGTSVLSTIEPGGTPLRLGDGSNGRSGIAIQRDNVIPVETAGGAQCFDVVDICLDHAEGVGAMNLAARLEERARNAGWAIVPEQVSQVITSSSIRKVVTSSGVSRDTNVGRHVMHADPLQSLVAQDRTLVEHELSREEAVGLALDTDLLFSTGRLDYSPDAARRLLVVDPPFGSGLELDFSEPYVMDRSGDRTSGARTFQDRESDRPGATQQTWSRADDSDWQGAIRQWDQLLRWQNQHRGTAPSDP